MSRTPPLSVLVVEDEPTGPILAARVAKFIGEWTGATPLVTVATTMAFAKARAHAYDAVLLDLCLPDSTREQTIAELPRLAETWPPIVIVTGLVESTSMWRWVELGADDFFDRQALVISPECVAKALVTAILRRHRINTPKEEVAA